MKKFFDYQLEHQVKVPNNPYTLFNFQKIKPYLEDIKRRYYNGDFGQETAWAYRPDSLFLTWVSDEYGIPRNELVDIFCDPAYEKLSQRSEVDSVNYRNPAYKEICQTLQTFLARELPVEEEGMKIQLHLQRPGQFHALHIDYVRTKVNGTDDISVDPNHTKFLIFFDDWQEGQAFQINQDFIKWKSCDTLTYNIRDSQHGSANFGYSDRFLLLVTAKYNNEKKNRDK
jgi:hypothetical protein